MTPDQLSAAFLACYLYYHFAVLDGQPTRFTGEGAVRYIYLGILLTHTLLAAAVPVVLGLGARPLFGSSLYLDTNGSTGGFGGRFGTGAIDSVFTFAGFSGAISVEDASNPSPQEGHLTRLPCSLSGTLSRRLHAGH